MRYLVFLLLISCPDGSSNHVRSATALQISGIPNQNLKLGSKLTIVVRFEGYRSEEIDGAKVTLKVECNRDRDNPLYEGEQSLVDGVATFPELDINDKFVGVCLAKASLTDHYRFYYQVDQFEVDTADQGKATSCQQLSRVKILLGRQLSICEESAKFKLSPQCGDGVAIFHPSGPTNFPENQQWSSSVVVVANGNLPEGCQLKINNKYYPIQSLSTENPIKGVITEVSRDDDNRIEISLIDDLSERQLYLSIDENDWQELYRAGLTSFSARTASHLEVLVSEKTDNYIWWDYYLKAL